VRQAQAFLHYLTLVERVFREGIAVVNAGLGVEKDQACDEASPSLELNGDFVCYHPPITPAQKAIGSRRVNSLDRVGIVFAISGIDRGSASSPCRICWIPMMGQSK